MVSYSAVDGDSTFRGGVAEYLTCGNDSVTIDLYGEWFWEAVAARSGGVDRDGTGLELQAPGSAHSSHQRIVASLTRSRPEQLRVVRFFLSHSLDLEQYG